MGFAVAKDIEAGRWEAEWMSRLKGGDVSASMSVLGISCDPWNGSLHHTRHTNDLMTPTWPLLPTLRRTLVAVFSSLSFSSGMNMAEGQQLVLSVRAAVIAVLHAYKYPSRPILGVLVGKREGKCLLVELAVPLFHTHLLTPMFEASMMMVDAFCEKEGLEVLGCYAANENVHDSAVAATTKAVGDKIKTYVPGAVIVQLNNERLKPEQMAEALVAYVSSEGSKKPWKRMEQEAKIGSGNEDPSPVLAAAVSDQKWRQVADFEGHLEDVSLDFLNRQLDL